MDKLKRIFALAGAILLVLLYVMTLVTALMSSPASKDWLTASIAATVIIPVFIYAFMLITRVTKEHMTESRLHEEMFMRQMQEQIKKQEEMKAAQGADLSEEKEAQATTTSQGKGQ